MKIALLALSVFIGVTPAALAQQAGAAPSSSKASPSKEAMLRDAAADVRIRQRAERGDVEAMVQLGIIESERNNEAKAVEWFSRAAEKKHTEGLFFLGVAYLEGKGGLKPDEARALSLFEQAAKAGHPSAMVFCGMIREAPNEVPRDDYKAVYWYTQAAKHNVPFAFRRLGQLQMAGRGGLAPNPATAARWFQKGADVGDAPSMTALGMMHVDGIGGFRKDYTEAVRLFTTASKAGDAMATSILAHAYLDGNLGLEQDVARSTKLFQTAAKSGHAHSMTMLAVAYVEGRGTPADPQKGVEWFEKAIEQGDTDAMLLLATMYAEGRGVKRHDARALHFYQRAAEGGNTAALVALAKFHGEGRGGLNADKARAFEFLKQAADKKEPLAYSAIAIAYTTGEGTERNPALAESFYKLAIQHAPNATHKGNYAWLLLGEGRVKEGLAMLDEALVAMNDGASDALRAECWFYALAFRPQQREEALDHLLTLVNERNARSKGWDFSRIVAQALKVHPKHPDAEHLAALADVISGKTDITTLAMWPAWQDAAAARTATVSEEH